MGTSIELTCPSCGKEFSFSYGIGFLPNEETLKREAGFKKVQRFIAEHPNGLADSSFVVKRCKKCGALKNCRDFTMYLPKDENMLPEYGNYFLTDPDNYIKYKDVSFLCRKCRGKEAEIIEMDELLKMLKNRQIKCPKCGESLSYENFDILKWD